MIQVPISVGELVDKITILEIKIARMQDPAKRENCRREYALLQEVALAHQVRFPAEQAALKAVNERLWEIEDFMRKAEAVRHFGDEFIELTRDEYRSNDERARIKKAINLAAGSTLLEEKEYVEYDTAK